MLFEIKHKYSDSVLFSVEAESFKIAVELAVKSKTDLSSANLRSANLSSADLDKRYYQIGCIGSRKAMPLALE